MARRRQNGSLQVLLLHNLDDAWTSAELASALDEVEQMMSALRGLGHVVFNQPVRSANLRAALRPYDPASVLVFNACEELPGVPNSETHVTAILDQLGFTYTGASSSSLFLSWDKDMVKRLLRAAGLNTPDGLLLHTPDVRDWGLFPAIVKPAHEHCSLGLSREAVVMTTQELERRAAWVIETFKQPALVEDFIDGREFHVSLWGNGTIEMLPPAEMDFSAFGDPRDRLCTYDSKFDPESRHYQEIELLLPAPLSDAEREALQRQAIGAYRTVGCRDYGRIDIRLRDGIFYVLDVNPNHDISAETSTAGAAEHSGFPYGAMLERIVNLARERHPVFKGGRTAA
ncbi:MAG: D-alanine--D-alanine ligase [Pseudomonadota bacterium]